MPGPVALQYGRCYHIHNRGNNRENIFAGERNYRYYLHLYAHYVEPVAETYAYCLPSNHFQFLMRIRDVEDMTCWRPRPHVNLSGLRNRRNQHDSE